MAGVSVIGTPDIVWDLKVKAMEKKAAEKEKARKRCQCPEDANEEARRASEKLKELKGRGLQ